MQVLSEEYQKELAQGVISVLDKALEGYSKLDRQPVRDNHCPASNGRART